MSLPVRGCHPLWLYFPVIFQLNINRHWPGPRSLATTNGVSVDVLSSGYLDVSVPRVCFFILCIQIKMTNKLAGFPHSEIHGSKRIAAPRGLSQRITSFIASYRQGIHQMPLSHLILLSFSMLTSLKIPSAEEILMVDNVSYHSACL